MLMTADHNSHNSHNRHATPSGSKTVRDPKINLSYVALLRRDAPRGVDM